jgi:general secretion pathway protein K
VLTKRTDRLPLSSRPRFEPDSDANDAGFALVAVIWSLGLISLLAIAVIVDARYRTRVTTSLTSMTAAAAAAESAVNLGIAAALARKGGRNVKFPLRCQMPGGERVVITVEQEAGKVDLNTATAAVLLRLFTALSLDRSAGARIAGNIMAFRDPDIKDGDARPVSEKPDDSKKIRFTTIMQLDQIGGISPALFRKAIRFVTVSSGRPEPDGKAASSELRKLLSLDQQQTDSTQASSSTGDMTIRADVSAEDGARFIREALVSFGTEKNRPFRIREWRHGDDDAPALARVIQPREAVAASQGSCFQVGNPV